MRSPTARSSSTYEWEGVPAAGARWLEARLPVRPGPVALDVAQDRLAEKDAFRRLGIGVAEYARGRRPRRARRRGRADGRTGDPQDAAGRLRRQGPGRAARRVRRRRSTRRGRSSAAAGALILEAMVPFDRELSVLAVRGLDGTTDCCPLVENVHRDGILRDEPCARARRRRRARPNQAATIADEAARRLRLHGRARGRALRRRRDAARERDRAARAQLRALDDRGRGDEPVREPPARRPRLAARLDRGARAQRDGQLHRRDARPRRGARGRRAPTSTTTARPPAPTARSATSPSPRRRPTSSTNA